MTPAHAASKGLGSSARGPISRAFIMKTSLLLLFVVAVVALCSNGGRSQVSAVAQDTSEPGQFAELERRVARIETHLGRNALGWRTSGTVAKRLEALERRTRESERDKQPSFPGRMNATVDPNRLAVDLRSLRQDFDALERQMREQTSRMSRSRDDRGSDSNRREIEQLRREVEKLRGDLQRLERR